MRLYLHWPFCISRCTYCDFNTRVAGNGVRERYRGAIAAEIEVWKRLLQEPDRRLESIYIGGGTPSTMSGDEVGELISEMTGGFGLLQGAEVTVEVNPGTWSYGDYYAAACRGVNRFSIGVQSLDDDILRMLGRAHGAGDAKRSLENALRVGGAAVSVDLLYALPEKGIESLRRTLGEVLAMRPHHISIYALTLERSVPLAERLRGGEIALPDEDEAADQYLMALDRLEKAGYRQYEISNFCLPGYSSRHNQAYWDREEYLGVGAGAHSFLGRCRFSNVRPVLRYMKHIQDGLLAVDRVEVLDAGDELEEEIMLGLRTSGGVPEDLLQGGGAWLEGLAGRGLLERRGGRIILTPEGMLLSNAVIGRLLAA